MSHHSETRVRVTGMTCGSCSARVDRALRDLDGVSAVEVRLREGIARVEHDPERASLETLIEAVREAGYEATPD